jgi:hypothetical protein
VPPSAVPARPSLAEVPAAPRRPSLRARRLIFRYTGRQFVLALVGAIFLVVGLGLLVPFCWGLPSDFAIALSKREVTGQVLRTQGASYTVNDESPTTVFYRYEYGGQAYESSSDIFAASPPLEAARGTVTVELAAFHPAFARIAGTHNSFFGAFSLFVLVFPLLGGLLLTLAIRSNQREIRAFVHGEPVLAQVVSVGEDHSTLINGKHPLVISWEFRVGGEVYAGSLSSMRHLELEEFLDAQELVVLHDPERPQINTLYVR